MRRTHVLRLVAAPAAALILLSGCGSDSSEGGDAADSSSQASPSESASSADAGESSGSGETLNAGDFGTKIYEAFTEAGTLSFEVTTEVSGQKSVGTGVADLTGKTPASKVDQKLPGGAGTVSVILVDGLYYIKTAEFGPKWVKIDPSSDSGLGALVGQLGASSDPSSILKAMDKAAEVTEEGSEKVGDVDTTKYHVVLPREALVEALGTNADIAKLLPENIEYDMWIDGDDLVRKQASEIAVSGQSSTTTILYDDFGDDVSIKAPAAGQTTTQVPGLTG